MLDTSSLPTLTRVGVEDTPRLLSVVGVVEVVEVAAVVEVVAVAQKDADADEKSGC